ncbi:ECF-type riboflavin transporter substrate-binding protein, partial [Vibrio splendidus]
AEPFTKVFTQLSIIAAGNTVLIAVVGFLILKSVAKRNKQSRNLTEA